MNLHCSYLQSLIFTLLNHVQFSFRDQLKRHYNLGQYWLEIEAEDVASFDETLADNMYKLPAEHLPLVGIELIRICFHGW